MADLTCTATSVAVVYPQENGTEIYPYIADVALTAGGPVYITSTGTVGSAGTATSGAQQFRGLALQTVGAGQGVDVLAKGLVEGYDLSGLAYDALVYGSDTVGSLATVAGTKTVVVGRVYPGSSRDSSGNIKKLLFVTVANTSNW